MIYWLLSPSWAKTLNLRYINTFHVSEPKISCEITINIPSPETEPPAPPIIELPLVESTPTPIGIVAYASSPTELGRGNVSLTFPVGGIYIPVNKLELLAPYIRLTILLAVAVMTLGYVKKKRGRLSLNRSRRLFVPLRNS